MTEDDTQQQPSAASGAPKGARLEDIPTRWSLLQLAHQAPTELSEPARAELVLKYSDAIKAYVRAMVRDEHVADDLTQDVVVRLLRGDFAGADPKRGRFRNLLKVAVRNMVKDFWSRSKRRAGVDYDVDLFESDEEDVGESLDREWVTGWRQSLLDLTWQSLEAYQNRQRDNVAYTVLRLRTENPTSDSEELAAALSAESGREFNAAAGRQQLRRARLRFAQLLVEEIVRSVEKPSPELVESELVDLGLIEHVKDFLPKDWRKTGELRGSNE